MNTVSNTPVPSGPINIRLQRGIFLKSFPTSSGNPEFITYSKWREARVYQVDCDLWAGSYWLKKAREVGPRVRGAKRDLSPEEAQRVVREVLQHLRENGFQADVSTYEREPRVPHEGGLHPDGGGLE